MKSKRKPCYASNGLPKVPGKPKGTDIIPAWLTPGEAVLSPGAAEMLGRGNVQALNKAASTMRLGTPQYKAEGGMMDDEAKRQEAEQLVSNPDQYNAAQVQAAQAFLSQQQTMQQPQYFMGGTAMVPRLGTVQPGYYGTGTGMVLGNRPRYMAQGGVLDEQKRRTFPDMPAVTQPQPQQPLPTGYGAGQAVNQALSNWQDRQSDNMRLIKGPIETGARSMAATAQQGGTDLVNGLSRLGNATMSGARDVYNAQGNFMRGALGMSPNTPSQQAPSLVRNAQADTAPGAGNVMGPPKPASLDQPKLPTSGGVPYIDQASADRASVARSMDPGYMTTPTGNMATRQTSPEELAKQKAGWEQLDKLNASQSRLGTTAVTRPTQPIQQMTQPVQQTLQAPRFGDADTQAFADRYVAYQNSPQRLVDMEDYNMRKYWGTVESLQSGLGSQDPDQARAYATALAGLGSASPDGARSAASMYGSDAAKYNSGLDYSAKAQEIMAGQGLRDAQAQNYQSDTNLQNAMVANPAAFSGRLGMRGMGGGSLKLEKAITGYDGMGNPIEASGVFDPSTGSFSQLPDPQTEMAKAKIRAAYPNATDAQIMDYLMGRKQNILGDK